VRGGSRNMIRFGSNVARVANFLFSRRRKWSPRAFFVP